MKLRGSCESFCPETETKMRIKEKLLNFYEYKNGQKNVPGLLVKEFTRSAAGVVTPKVKDMRTEECLVRTVEYLFKEICLDKRKPFRFAYDFIFDRLRAVRQEIVIQEFDSRQSVRLMEPMIMFLAYSLYTLSTEPIDNFDPKICQQHLQECLKRVLCCYDDLEKDPQTESLRNLQRRYFIEALYQIFNLGVFEALSRGLTLPLHVRQDEVFKLAFNISMDYHRGHLYRVLQNIPTLPHIMCSLASLKMQTLRRRLLALFSHAYHNKVLTVPVTYLIRLLVLKSPNVLFQQCRQYNITVSKDRTAVLFYKNDYNGDINTLKSMHESFVNAKLERINLPEVLLLKKF
ncbi:germinal-center associated nuclear protein [Scaptodrosophila lebanonensis]|uniref:Germinal-center associated nuclear protein n=1 Tax=Drosophila lebanonensis TaxID=7225 RepID=A0A6J2UBM2_DROLE|nr:germinal-center associated nuclear protein [Scaptodrosophila lebanonensis]